MSYIDANPRKWPRNGLTRPPDFLPQYCETFHALSLSFFCWVDLFGNFPDDEYGSGEHTFEVSTVGTPPAVSGGTYLASGTDGTATIEHFFPVPPTVFERPDTYPEYNWAPWKCRLVTPVARYLIAGRCMDLEPEPNGWPFNNYCFYFWPDEGVPRPGQRVPTWVRDEQDKTQTWHFGSVRLDARADSRDEQFPNG